MIDYRPTIESDHADVEALLDKAFGPDRQEKTAYRLREGVAPIAALSLVAEEGSTLRGTISYWPIIISDQQGRQRRALMLGPLAVDPDYRGSGIGIELMQRTLDHAARLGHDLVILVGDLDYYSRVGFSRDGTDQLRMPGPVDQKRVLRKNLAPSGEGPLVGTIARAMSEPVD